LLPPDLIILMYHHVAEPPRGASLRGLYVTPRQFAWQMDRLRNAGVRFCTFASLTGGTIASAASPSTTRAGAAPQGGSPHGGKAAAPGPWVLVTFDDGYRDVYEHAWPVLRERGIPAVVYPVVGDIGKSGVVWPESTDRTPADVLTELQVREMARGGIEFGSHLLDHVHADRLALPDLRRQLARSREGLALIAGSAPLSIAYPFGSYTPQVAEEAARAGYRYGVTTRAGSNRGAPPLELRRTAVKGTRLYHRWRFAWALRREIAAAKAAVQVPE
jgi:peptidoglycan/xylan/chitin deacetylase (PgdA/CDA1 family)